MYRQTKLMLVAALVACSTDPVPLAREELRVGDLLREHVTTLEDELQLSMPGGFVVHDRRLFILDRGNNRVTVTDTLFRLVDRFGREGQGPGEFDVPWDVEVMPEGRLAVTEMQNRRISVFTTEGEFLKSVPLATPHDDVAAMDDSTFVVSGPGAPHQAALKNTPTGVAPFSESVVPPWDPMEIVGDHATRVETEIGDLAVIVRALNGRIEVFDRGGTLVRLDSIPRDLGREAFEGAAKSEEAWARQGVTATVWPLKPPTATASGRLLIPLTGQGPLAVLYSPLDGSFTPLIADGDERSTSLLRRANSFFLDGNTLYAMSSESIAAFPVTPSPSS